MNTQHNTESAQEHPIKGLDITLLKTPAGPLSRKPATSPAETGVATKFMMRRFPLPANGKNKTEQKAESCWETAWPRKTQGAESEDVCLIRNPRGQRADKARARVCVCVCESVSVCVCVRGV